MLGRISAAAAALIALSACAGVEPAGRNARTGGAPVMAEAPAPRPAPQRTLPPPQPTPAPQQQATATPPALQVPQTVSPPPQPSAPPQQVAAATPPPAQQVTPTPTPRTTTPPQPDVAAQGVSAPPPPPVRQRPSDEVVVPGVREQQVPPPAGDPRSVSQRMEDINAWDRCVTRVQAAFDTDPTRPQLETPEEVCSQSLGMASRTAVPDSRIRR